MAREEVTPPSAAPEPAMGLAYHSIQLLRVNDTRLALIYYGTAFIILAYVIGVQIYLNKGYQEVDTLTGFTMAKVKGSAGITVNGKFEVHDDNDLVPDPNNPGSVFITTNFLETKGQQRGQCSGDEDDGLCDCEEFDSVEECCKKGKRVRHGVTTGKCAKDKFCEVEAWCPIEKDEHVGSNILEDVAEWTLFTRVSVDFPKFGVRMTNVKDELEKGKNLFVLKDLLEAAGTTFDVVKEKGAVIMCSIIYNCDLDQDIHECQPEVQFMQLTEDLNATKSISKGFNFRVARKYVEQGREQRDLSKVYGIQILVSVSGTAGRFGIVPLLVNFGAGMGLMGVATILCDFIMQYMLKHKDFYVSRKYDQVHPPEDDEEPLLGDNA